MSDMGRQVNEALLSQLRWGVDSRITNHEGEDVWLRPCLDEHGRRSGITECCYHGSFVKVDTGEVCERHGTPTP